MLNVTSCIFFLQELINSLYLTQKQDKIQICSKPTIDRFASFPTKYKREFRRADSLDYLATTGR